MGNTKIHGQFSMACLQWVVLLSVTKSKSQSCRTFIIPSALYTTKWVTPLLLDHLDSQLIMIDPSNDIGWVIPGFLMASLPLHVANEWFCWVWQNQNQNHKVVELSSSHLPSTQPNGSNHCCLIIPIDHDRSIKRYWMGNTRIHGQFAVACCQWVVLLSVAKLTQESQICGNFINYSTLLSTKWVKHLLLDHPNTQLIMIDPSNDIGWVIPGFMASLPLHVANQWVCWVWQNQNQNNKVLYNFHHSISIPHDRSNDPSKDIGWVIPGFMASFRGMLPMSGSAECGKIDSKITMLE